MSTSKPVTLYWRKTCTTCRNARALLTETGIPFEERDMIKQPITEEELRRYAKVVGLPALINRKGRKYKALGLESKQLSDDEWFALLASDPDLVKRPIVVIGDEVIPGLDRERITALTS